MRAYTQRDAHVAEFGRNSAIAGLLPLAGPPLAYARPCYSPIHGSSLWLPQVQHQPPTPAHTVVPARNALTGEHIPMRTGRPLIGTARFASVHSHQGLEQSRRDDLESLGCALFYLLVFA